MSSYTTRSGRTPRFKRLWLVAAGLLCLILIGMVAVRQVYYKQLKAVNNDQSTQIFTVENGSSVKQIAANLEKKHLIRSAWALELYVHSKELGSAFQAGTYALSPSVNTERIVSTLTKGKVATSLVTILPGRRIDQVRADLINEGFLPAAVDRALQPERYADLAALAYKPANATSLEGLLWPDSYQKEAGSDPTVIVRAALKATAEHVTPELQTAFAAHGLSPYQGIILASIIEQEVSKPSDRAQAAQVFLSRMQEGTVLGSDVTAIYGSIVADRQPDLSYDSPYNTLMHPGLPPSPISTVSAGSLQAASNPASTDWRFFVAGDDGTTYFSKTNAEHEALAEKYCHKLCGR